MITTQDPGATTTAPLANAWLYWREGGTLTLLRTDPRGQVLSLRASGERTFPWEYTTRHNATAGAQVDLYFSRGTKPIPDAQLNAHLNIFHRRTVPGPAAAAGSAPVAPNNINTLALPPPVSITLPNLLLALSTPAELSLWPLLWELPSDTYEIDGLAQGAALWTGSSLSVTENRPAPAPGPRPRERGLKIQGTIDARATGAILRVLDASGNVVQLRQSIGSSAGAPEITATLGAAAGNTKPYDAAAFFANAANAFGPVQIFIESQGMTPPIVEAFALQLSGVQLALVDDHTANINGQHRGPVQGEADEIIIIDFLSSPAADVAAISAQTRARRMASYRTRSRDRPLSATNATIVEKPEMPLWMGEFHLVGLTKSHLEDLMLRRSRQLATAPTSLRVHLDWKLTLSWDGPDIATGSPRLYSYSQTVTHSHDATVTLARIVRIKAETADAVGRKSGTSLRRCSGGSSPGGP
jgi:hypothetical protein